MGVYDQRANRPCDSATGALCTRGRQIRHEYLTQDTSRRISVDTKRVGKTLARASRLVRSTRSTFIVRSFFIHAESLVAF